MTKTRLFIAIILCLFIFQVKAQTPTQPIQFKNGPFLAGDNFKQPNFNKNTLSTAVANQTYFVIIQFGQLPDESTKQQLANLGVQLSNYIPGHAYLATLPESINFQLLRNFKINAIQPIPTWSKIDSSLIQPTLYNDRENLQLVAVEYFSVVSRNNLTQTLSNLGARVTSTKFDGFGKIFIAYDAPLLEQIAKLPMVYNLYLQNLTDKALNYASKGAHGVSALQSASGKYLRGTNVTVGIGDNADISTHTDFTGRLINRSPWVPSDHGTHTAGTTAGGGIMNPKNAGMAPKATIVNQFFSDILLNAVTYATDYNLVLTNNSYHSANTGCSGEGNYDGLSNFADAQMYANPQLLHVIAAGNDGQFTCSPYPSYFGTVKSGWQSAKNVLTVGAINIQDYSIANFSSRGPVKDGRLKPEITSNGWAVLSTISNGGYGYNYGTSMATPVVTGSLTLLYERYRQKNLGQNPKSSLIKAIACNTAEDLGNAGPDFTFGFGMLNARRAVDIIDSSRFIVSTVANGATNNHVIAVPAGSRKLKVMIHWLDPAAATNAASTLVNDLNLSVLTPSAQSVLPLILNASGSNVTLTATNGIDHTNNIEQVIIDNPAGGNYTFSIQGYAIPSGTQEYALTWDFVQTGVTVEYPYGGETLVPGETETIRWSGYGNESSTYTVEYSENNGSTWTTLNSSVAASARSLSWVVPSTATNLGKIRVSRNGGGPSGQSAAVFTVLPAVTIAASNPCQGAVQLSWSAATGATSYDILQFTADSMRVIANTTSTSYLVTALSKNTSYLFSVAAKNGSVSGRRSNAVRITPSSGACTLAAFNNDIRVDSILEPNTARRFFANEGNAIKPVRIRLKNTGGAAISGSFTVSYQYNNTTINENLTATIAAGATYNYTFTTMYTYNPTGFTYNFKSWVTLATDPNHANDTATKEVKYINNDAITNMPVIETFESMPELSLTKKELAVGGLNRLDFSASTTLGRMRSFVNSGIALEGSKALTLDQSPYSTTATKDSAFLSYNLQQYSNTNQLRFDFNYKNHGQAANPGNKIWIRGSESNSWIEAYDLVGNQAGLASWKKGLLNINELLSNANPPQSPTSTFQVLIGQEGYTSANVPNAIVDTDDGYTFDNIVLNEAFNDVGLSKINFPATGGCGLTANNPIGIRVRNYNNTTLNNVTVGYRINNGPIITETIPTLTANQTLDYTFSQTANLAAYIEYQLDIWINYPADTYRSNDSILQYTVHNSPVINTFPYHEGFETNNGNYYTKGTNSSWMWGTPTKTNMNKAPNGSKAWVTNLYGNYSDNETSYLISPCFNLSQLSKPVLSFSHNFMVELDYDYTWVEYTLDGNTWQKLGTVGSGTNWYDNSTFNNWSVSNTQWHVASFPLPTTNASLKFRIVMTSDGGVTEEGVAIDDIRVHEASTIVNAPASFYAVSADVNGSNWIPFKYTNIAGDSTYILGEINANGQDLGNCTLTYYPNLSGIARFTDSQYYLNRNYVFKTGNQPTRNLQARIYFTDKEVNDLLAATACTTCQPHPNDAYELSVTQFSGNNRQTENDNLADNLYGTHQWISAENTAIMPHGIGYYAEFTASAGGEWWLSKGKVTAPLQPVCANQNISYSVDPNLGNNFQWQVNNGSGYTNLTDNINYSGSNSNQLTITNLPTTATGNRYRCLVDGLAKDEHVLRFVQVWIGMANTDWFNFDNWSCNSIPDANTDVIIPDNTDFMPVININTAIRGIHVDKNATITIANGATLIITGRD